MKINSSKMMFYLMIFMSTMMVMSSNNVLFTWMNMEINMIVFIPMIIKSKKMNDQTMKYLIIQSLASSILLMSIILNSIIETPFNESNLILTSMMMKLGIMPLHLWMPNLMMMLSWEMCILMTTWQKLSPIIMNFQLTKMTMMNSMLMLTLILSPIVGMKQTSSKKMMAYSSISNSPWMIYSIFNSKMQFMYFFTIYSMLTMMTFKLMKQMSLMFMNQTKLMKKSQMISLYTMMLSMSGMPPFLGFFPKWMILQTSIQTSMMLSITMIISAMISTYMYLNMVLNTMTNMNQSKNNKSKNNQMYFMLLNLTGLPLMLILKTT